MGMTIEKAFFALLRFELSGTKLCDDVKNFITTSTLVELFKLSKKHDLAHLIASALDSNNLFTEDDNIKKRFLQERNLAVFRYEQQNYEYNRICQVLEKVEIDFVPLKGAVIRDYYPEPWMRTSCDIDILVKEEELDRAAEYLCKELGYSKEEKRSANELSLYFNNVHIELHYDLTEGDKYGAEVLSNVWQYVKPRGCENNHLILIGECFYFYHIAHMIKHFEYGGCGVRPFLDLWLLNKKIKIDSNKRGELLEKGGLLKFANASERLSEVWFGENAADELSTRMEEFILTGGLYGSMHNMVSMQQAKKGGKLKYILSRIFISNKELKIKYPILEKRPYLIPFYHIKRWVKPLTQKESNKRSMKVLTETSSVKNSDKKAKEKLLLDLGLKQ